jgi:pSer/pThr/pTyr-binding forkhead associated (FHA) protein
MIMSGVDDGTLLKCSLTDGDGELLADDVWVLTIGRQDSNDICLSNDTFVSRQHAYIYFQDSTWYIEDRNSTNGTFIEMPDEDRLVQDRITLLPGQLFRIGRTWLRIETD